MSLSGWINPLSASRSTEQAYANLEHSERLLSSMQYAPNTGNPMSATNRRCEDCDPTTNWVFTVKFCPHHGKPVAEYPVEACDCGEKLPRTPLYKFCTNCGKPLPNRKGAA